MRLESIAVALPVAQNTGWGVAGRRITEELKKIALVHDLTQTSIVRNDLPVDIGGALITAVRGVDMLPLHHHIYADRTVGYSFCEDNLLLRRYALNAAHCWDEIVVGSTWAAEEMQATVDAAGCGNATVSVAIQGVDGEIFKPSEEIKPDPDLFTIFSGGKFELRKGQDVVIRAVAVMMERHKDVRLVAAWHNPWKQSEDTMQASKLLKPYSSNGPHFAAWDNGIPRDRVEFIGHLPHADTVAVMNRCDIGLFTNRCEAGTNLVLMEAMSCGLPVIATTQHGHKDVTRWLNFCSGLHNSKTFIVERSNGVESMPVAEWFEPDLDETIATIEASYQSRGSVLLEEGARNREAMKAFTWADCVKSLLEACRS